MILNAFIKGTVFVALVGLFFLASVAVAAIDMVPVEWLGAALALAVGAIVVHRAR